MLYLALTIALAWPLPLGLTRHPGGLRRSALQRMGDGVDATHLGRGWWSANICAVPLALIPEHFLPQGLQALPIYWATRNPILGYNLVFLPTFVLSGLGMFLLARELSGSRAAGVVAGLAYAFSPFRVASIPHLQVLSAAWMPFALYGLRRHFSTGRLRPLAGAAVAWIAQNLSCGYYLLFFSRVVALYLAWELTTRRLWTDRRALMRAAGTCAVVFIVTLPFLLPYLELRRLGFDPRSLTETKRFSADVYAYFTADPGLWFWGPRASAWPRAEGSLFPGLTIVLLAAFGAVARSTWTGGREGRPPAWHRLLMGVVIVCWLAVLLLLLGKSIRLPGLRITEFSRTMIVAAGASVVLLAVSPVWRAALRRCLATPAGIFSIITIFAAAMSLGPDITAKGREVAGISLYAAFYRLVPGFDGLRVLARYAMIVTPRPSPCWGLSAWPRSIAAAGVTRAGCRRPDRVRGDRDSDPDQPVLRRVYPAGARAAASRRGDGRRRRAGGLRLHRTASGFGRRHRVAARRAGIRCALHVVFDAPLEAAGQRVQRRRAAALRVPEGGLEGRGDASRPRLAGDCRLHRDPCRGPRRCVCR